MAIDTTTPRSRRSLLLAAFGGVAAAAAGLVSRAAPVEAASGDFVHVGATHLGATPTTILYNDVDGLEVFLAKSDRNGTGVRGTSPNGFGVHGQSNTSAGVRGTGQPGVLGETVSTGLQHGVIGHTESSEGIGVLGENKAPGSGGSGSIGVLGTTAGVNGTATVGLATGHGTGVIGASSSQVPTFKPQTGVFGYTNGDATSVGVRGLSESGRGGVFGGGVAQLRLLPNGNIHPTTGQRGDLYADGHGRLFFCKGGSNWKQLA